MKQVLEGPINSVIHEGDKYEVNPLKISGSANLESNIQSLREGLQTFMEAILGSISICPLYVNFLFTFDFISYIYLYFYFFYIGLLGKYV